MLGETANIRSNKIPYFQVFIIFDKVPYFKKGGEFSKYDNISEHNMIKYLNLSNDNPELFQHTPDKTLVVLVKLKEKSQDYQFIIPSWENVILSRRAPPKYVILQIQNTRRYSYETER